MKSLIVYFSRRGENYAVGNISEGNAEHIAKVIAKITNGDIFEVESIKDYSTNYKKCTEEALDELNENATPKLKNNLTTIEQYDVIYLCYPNWWGTYPRPLKTFLLSHNFKDKVIMPMCTHEGSGMGSSESELKGTLKGAIIKKGLAIKGTLAHTSDERIKKWIENEIG